MSALWLKQVYECAIMGQEL